MIRIRRVTNVEQEPCLGCAFRARHGHELTAGVGPAVRRVFLCKVCLRVLMATATIAVAEGSGGPERPLTGRRNGTG